MPRAAHTATRTCVACRRRFAASDLLRLTLDEDGVLQADPTGRALGRGAWVCWAQGCLARVQDKPGMAGRSLRRRPKQAGPLLATARAFQVAGAAAALQRCHQAGLTRARQDQRERVAPNRAVAVLRPRDAPACVDGPGPAELPTPWTAAGLGEALGRGPRSRVLLLEGAPTRRLLRKLRVYAALG